jgi:hypothetical protein
MDEGKGGSLMGRIRLFVCILLLLAVTTGVFAEGYVVILKSGHKIRCREPMRIEDSNAIITLVTGTVASYPVDQVDIVETERYNQMGLGDALLIDELSMVGTPIPTPTPKLSLGQYASIDASYKNPELGSTMPPTPTPTPGIRLQTVKYHDERVDQAFSKFFDERNLYIYRTSAGTQPNFIYIQTVTDSQREVFQALEIVSEAYTLIHRLQPEIAPGAVELQMIQTTGKPAGTFRLSPDQAAELADNKISVEQFYVNYVIF